MNDKFLMEDLLLLQKGICDLFMHGAIESSTAEVHQAFKSALNEALCMQYNLYSKMSAKGWYPTEQAPQQKLDAVKQKFRAKSAQ